MIRNSNEVKRLAVMYIRELTMVLFTIQSYLLVFFGTKTKPTPTPTTTPIRQIPPSSASSVDPLLMPFVVLLLITLVLLGIVVLIVWLFWTKRLQFENAAGKSETPTRFGKRVSGSAPYSNNQPSSPFISVPSQINVKTSYSHESSSSNQYNDGRMPSPPLQSQPVEPLSNKPWVGLVEECVELFNELDGLTNLDDSSKQITRHVNYRLEEILQRSGIEIIDQGSTFNRSRHQAVGTTSSVAQGTPIAETLSPGFAVGRRVLRRARVRVADASFKEVDGYK